MLARLQKAATIQWTRRNPIKTFSAIEPDNEDALTGLALVYSDLGDNRKAAELLKVLADKNPTPRSLTALAAAYEQMRDFKGAAEVLSKLLEANPANEREVKRNLAQDLMLSQEYARSLEVYGQLVAADPADAQSYLRMSQIYRQLKDFPKAREASDKAKAVEPNSIEIRYKRSQYPRSRGPHRGGHPAFKRHPRQHHQAQL